MTSKRTVVVIMVVALLILSFYLYPRQQQRQPEPPARPHKVTVKWDPVPKAASYNIFRRTYRSVSYTKVGTSATNTYEESNVQSAEEYCYQITSVDAKGLESVRSKDLCVTVPNP